MPSWANTNRSTASTPVPASQAQTTASGRGSRQAPAANNSAAPARAAAAWAAKNAVNAMSPR